MITAAPSWADPVTSTLLAGRFLNGDPGCSGSTFCDASTTIWFTDPHAGNLYVSASMLGAVSFGHDPTGHPSIPFAYPNGSIPSNAYVLNALLAASQTYSYTHNNEYPVPVLQLNAVFNMPVDLGGRIVEVRHFGFAQTRGDLVVWTPDARVLWVGNMIQAPSPALPWLLEGRHKIRLRP